MTHPALLVSGVAGKSRRAKSAIADSTPADAGRLRLVLAQFELPERAKSVAYEGLLTQEEIAITEGKTESN